MRRCSIGKALGLAAVLVGFGALAATAVAAPVKLTVGYGPASDVVLDLIKLKPDIAKFYGKTYTVDLQQFPSSSMRFKGYLSGALDGATGSASSVLTAASKGIDAVMVASVSKESSKGFSTSYMVRADSPIRKVADLKGKVIGLNGHRSSIELWARRALTEAGLNPDRDVKFVVAPFPLQGRALRTHQIDLGAFPQPFAALAESKGGVRVLFTAQDAVHFDQEAQVLFFRRAVLDKSPAAVRGFLADAVAATRFYLDHPKQARQLLLDAHVVRAPAAAYLGMKDYYRSPDMSLDLVGLDKMQKMDVAAGYQDKAVDLKKVVDTSFLPH